MDAFPPCGIVPALLKERTNLKMNKILETSTPSTKNMNLIGQYPHDSALSIMICQKF